LKDLQKFQKNFVVIGDFCLDKYVYSNHEEDDVSVEKGEAAKIACAVSSITIHILGALVRQQ
jgi:bifunctional ADP-heptose synthase (sugar kinase/adenylyltransferase)